MKKSIHTFSFSSKLEDVRTGMLTTLVVIPVKIIDQLPEGQKEQQMEPDTFSLAINNLKSGERYFAVSNALRKAAKIGIGDPVQVDFHLVDPNIVELPEELEAVIAQDPDAEKIWQTFTPRKTTKFGPLREYG